MCVTDRHDMILAIKVIIHQKRQKKKKNAANIVYN